MRHVNEAELDRAIAAHMSHDAGVMGDPLTECLMEQSSGPAPLLGELAQLAHAEELQRDPEAPTLLARLSAFFAGLFGGGEL